VVVVDENVLTVLVDVEALEMQARYLADPPTGAFQQLIDENGHVTGLLSEDSEGGHPGRAWGARNSGEDVNVSIQLGDDGGW
jgi:hypothetical protein